MSEINYCGLSGGKDSAATALWLVHESGVPLDSIRLSFCDTSNENRITYAHVMYLSRYFAECGCEPVEWLYPERAFLELAEWKGRFPSRKARFCTQFLKVIPSRQDVSRFIEAGHDVVVHSGVRASESADRTKLVDRGFDDMFGCTVNRPMLRKSLQDVIGIHAKYGVRLNPLYRMGFKRVGCFPCINSTKSEVKLISIHFPGRIDEIRQEERSIRSTFFHRNTVPKRFRSIEVDTKQGPMKVATIDDVVRWSHTGKRAQEKTEMLFDDFYPDDENLVCPSGMGMCE